jgi:hypothetical protein
MITQLVKKFPAITEREGLFLCPQERSTSPYTEPDVSSQQLPTVFF